MSPATPPLIAPVDGEIRTAQPNNSEGIFNSTSTGFFL